MTSLHVLKGSRVPESPGHPFLCAYLRGTLTGAECLRRQTKREVVRSTGVSRVPERLEYCASGKCGQGNEIRAKFPDWKPEERTRPDPSWATFVQVPTPRQELTEPLPPAIAEDIAEDLARAAQQAERDQAAAAVEEVRPDVAERSEKARRSWDEFREKKEKRRAAEPVPVRPEREAHPLSKRGLTESKEEKKPMPPGTPKDAKPCTVCGEPLGNRSVGGAHGRCKKGLPRKQRNGAPPPTATPRRKILGRRARAAQRADAPSGSAPDDVEEILAKRLTYYRAEAERCERALRALRR